MQDKSRRLRTAEHCDRVAEWLRRWTANPIRSPCVGSNPIPVGTFSCGGGSRKLQKQLLFAKAIRKDSLQDKSRRPRTAEHCDRVAEWLRRWTANPIRSPCVGSNPIPVGIFSYGGGSRKFQKQLLFAKAIRKDLLQDKSRRPRTAGHCDRVAEWLRRWTANPIRSPCVGSNPITVGTFSYGGGSRKFQKQLLFAKAIRKDTLQDKSRRPRTAEHCDRVAEWLRRWTANPIRSPCVGSNPIPVGTFSYGGGSRKLQKQLLFAKAIRKDSLQDKSRRPRTAERCDRVAEWLRRWTANPIRSPCVGSNPIPVGIFSYGGGSRKFQKTIIIRKSNQKRYIAGQTTKTSNCRTL